MGDMRDILKIFEELPILDQELVLEKLLIEHELKMPVIEKAKDRVLLIEQRKPCPYCKSSNIYKRGSQHKVKMYSCKDCKKWYSHTTGTPLWDIKSKQKWAKYLHCMSEGYSLRKSAKITGICIQTSFDWRHKILASLSSLVPQKLSGTVECDELELSVSNKGDKNLLRKPRKRSSGFSRNKSEDISVVQVVTATQRGGDRFFKVVETKRLSEENVTKALNNKIEKGTTLITDKHPTYKAFGKANPDIVHKSVKSVDYIDKNNSKIHIQSVNQLHKQTRKFLDKFNGVSTKYLQNYLNWFAYQSKVLNAKSVLLEWVITGLLDYGAYQLFKNYKLNVVNIRT